MAERESTLWSPVQELRGPWVDGLSNDVVIRSRSCSCGHGQGYLTLPDLAQVGLEERVCRMRSYPVEDRPCEVCGQGLAGCSVEGWVGTWLPSARRDLLVYVPSEGPLSLALWDGVSPPEPVALDHPVVAETARANATRHAFDLSAWTLATLGADPPFDAARAIEALECVLQEWPEYPYAMRLLALARRSKDDRQEAIRWLERAVALDPDDAEAHFLLGVVLDECGRDACALQAYDRSLELAPGDPTTHSRRGMVLERTDRLDEALQSYGKALALNPHHRGTLTAMSDAWLTQGRRDLAASCLALIRPFDLLACHPDVASKVMRRAVHLGTALAQEERWLEAARVFEVACGLAPRNVDCCFNHAICLFHADAYRDAWARLRHALDLDPGYGPASQLMPRFEEAADKLREVRGFGSLLASFSLHTVGYHDSFGRASTMFNVVVPLETQTQFVRTESERLSLDSDRHLLDLLLAKGHNARVQQGLEGRPMVFAVGVEPAPGFLAFAASLTWTTAKGSRIESAPVPVLFAPSGIPERSLLPETDGPFQLQRTLELEQGGPECFYPEEYSVRS